MPSHLADMEGYREEVIDRERSTHETGHLALPGALRARAHPMQHRTPSSDCLEALSAVSVICTTTRQLRMVLTTPIWTDHPTVVHLARCGDHGKAAECKRGSLQLLCQSQHQRHGNMFLASGRPIGAKQHFLHCIWSVCSKRNDACGRR